MHQNFVRICPIFLDLISDAFYFKALVKMLGNSAKNRDQRII